MFLKFEKYVKYVLLNTDFKRKTISKLLLRKHCSTYALGTDRVLDTLDIVKCRSPIASRVRFVARSSFIKTLTDDRHGRRFLIVSRNLVTVLL